MPERPKLRFPIGEKVPIEFKCVDQIVIEKYSLKISLYVADILEDWILGLDFFMKTELDKTLETFIDIPLSETDICLAVERDATEGISE